jgi:hypothetical protein
VCELFARVQLVKLKQATFFNFIVHLYTVISPHSHLSGLQTIANIQVISLARHNTIVLLDGGTT